MSTIPALGLELDDLVLGKPYWIIMCRESLEPDNFIFRVYDGVSGSFIKEKKSKILKN